MSDPEIHDDEANLDAQQAFVESALEVVFDTYRGAIEEGIAAPIVVLLDCEDELGGQIARGWLGDEAIDDAIAVEHAAADDEAAEVTTAFARALPFAEAASELSEAFPYLADSLAEVDPNDGVVILGVSAGGACLLTAPVDALDGDG